MKAKVHPGKPITIGEVTIIPLVRVCISHGTSRGRLSLYATKEAVAIVVTRAGEVYALNTLGEPLSLEACIQQAPELKQVLDSR